MAALFLLDGHSLAYRAFFALPAEMATAAGQQTNAVVGFTSMLVTLLKEHEPSGVAVAFDRPEPTFRHERYEGYKEGRAATPEPLREQIGLIRQLVSVLGIPAVEKAGVEADDVIATLATRARDAGREVVVVTGDRDAFQLVEDPFIRVLYNRRGVSDYVLYDEAGIVARTGVPPRLYVELAALRGDPSDNIPGVPGIGEKTAAKLLTTWGGLEGVLAHLDQLTPKLAASLAEHQDRVRANVELIRAVRDVELEVDPATLQRAPFDVEEARQLFGFLELRSLWPRTLAALGASEAGALERQAGPSLPELEVHRPEGAAAAAAGLAAAVGASGVAVHAIWSGQPGRSGLRGLAVESAAGEAGEAGAGEAEGRVGSALREDDAASAPAAARSALWLDDGLLASPEVQAALRELFGPGGPELSGYRVKELMRTLAPVEIELARLGVDAAVAAYVLDPADGAATLEDLARRYLGVDLAGPDTSGGQLDLDAEPEDLGAGAAARAAASAALSDVLRRALAEKGQTHLYEEIERPLVGVLARMEVVGIQVDVAYLRDLVAELSTEAKVLEDQVQDLAGVRFNVGSTPQLRTVLYETLGLTPQRRTKTGYSTDAATLERLRDQHPMIGVLLRYREVEKLRNTFGESLLAEVAEDERIHASFNQTVARTGRLSSDHPNLHNIPVRSEDGRRFRRAFVPAPGWRLLVADYDQVELRVIAHLTGDPGLLEAFRTGVDIHAATAARVFGVAESAVTPSMRAKAKMVSYGLAYGMEAYGLSQRLGVPVAEAEEILAAYFAAFPAVRSYMERTVAEARERGYTETPLGRRRMIPELASSNYRLRQAGERQAMNAGIQGLAADLFKVALVRLDEHLRTRRSRLVLQVHDEVLVEAAPEEVEELQVSVPAIMGEAFPMDVPLSVHLAVGESWAEAKP